MIHTHLNNSLQLDIIIIKKNYAEGLYLNMYMCLKFQGHFIIIDQFYLIFSVDVFCFQYYLVLLGILLAFLALICSIFRLLGFSMLMCSVFRLSV